MTTKKNDRPQVPGASSGDDADDGGQARPGAWGAKNPRVRSTFRYTTQAKHKPDNDTTLHILTYNTRTLQTEDRLLELENALKEINWDIVGLAEVRRNGEETIERETSIFYHYGQTGGLYGVGFLVAKRWKNNILEFISYSDRIAVLKFQISSSKTLTIVQVYAPTSSHPDAEIEEFYDLLNKACDEHRSTWNIVLGDFNAKIGQKQDMDNELIVGPHGSGNRNERGSRLIQFAFGQNLCIGNTFYYKKEQRRWTWISPNNVTKNEIDYILSSNKKIINNVQVINQFKFSSDHRPVRAVIKLNVKMQRKNLFKNKVRRLNKESLIACKKEFNLELRNSFDLLNVENEEKSVDLQYKEILNSITKASKVVKQNKLRTKKLSGETKKLIEERQALSTVNRGYLQYRLKDKEVKRSIRKDIREYNKKQIQNALEKNRSLKIAKQGITNHKSWITCLTDSRGVKQFNRDKVLEICTTFYKNLYSDTSKTQPISSYSCSENIPPISEVEVRDALSTLKYNRSCGEDGVSTEALKIGEPSLLFYLTKLFNDILCTGNLPSNFCHSNIILLHKKGDKSDINNYRPISLISHVYKTFIKVIEKRIAGQLDLKQPPEQAGFRRGLSTTDHLHTVNQIVEKYQEYKTPLYLAFVDYSKAFDSITHSAIFNALTKQQIEPTYIHLLRNIYTHSTAAIKLESLGPKFDILKGVKQGDPLSPKLFTSTLEEVFQTLAVKWEGKGLVVGETRLNNLRFADDIVLFSPTATGLEQMLQDLSDASLEVGLKMNMSKTKLMTNSSKRSIHVGGENIQYVQEYIYLGQVISFQARQDKEIARRTENAWKSYWSMKEYFKGTLPLSLKRKLMDMCILPILTYGAQTWSLTNIQKSKLKVCQRAMERSILGVKLTDHVRNTTLRSKTQITDVAQKVAQLKWDWAGHVCRMPNELWARKAQDWCPETVTRGRGRPRRRWRDELDVFLENWKEVAQSRDRWKEWREAFAQQWDSMG